MQRQRVNLKLVQQECKLRHKKQTFRHHSQANLYIDTSNLWKAKSSDEEKLFRAIKRSDIFSSQRCETFIKFNYRTVENNSICYENIYQQILSPFNHLQTDRKCHKGSMNINELWSEKNLQELLGSLPFPKDRLKVLNSYPKNKTVRTKYLKNKKRFEKEN